MFINSYIPAIYIKTHAGYITILATSQFISVHFK